LPAIVALVLIAPDAPGATITAGDRATAARALSGSRFLRFAVIGDFGTGGTTQKDVADRMCRRRNSYPFDFVITTGDNIYPDGSAQYFDSNFFQPYDCLLENDVAFRSTLGNHDVITDNGRPELNEPAFGMPSRNYVFRISGVRFVMVESNVIARDWLRRATRSREDDTWTVVAFHHPVFSPGTHGSTDGMRPWMPRLFRDRGVDIVFNGHDHLYAVSKPIRRVRYVVTGGGGAGLYTCRDRWFSDICLERHHFLTVRAGAEQIRVTAVPPRGKRFHTFTTTGIAGR
jgi:Calcineurin-like phosphoesterase